MAKLPSVGVDAGYRVVTEEELHKGAQAVQGATVHLCQVVVLQVTAFRKEKKNSREICSETVSGNPAFQVVLHLCSENSQN